MKKMGAGHHKPTKMGQAKPPAGGSAGPIAAAPGKAGGAIGLKPPGLKQFGHEVPKVKPLNTDRGSFKIKG
jgi:hypothetical protein